MVQKKTHNHMTFLPCFLDWYEVRGGLTWPVLRYSIVGVNGPLFRTIPYHSPHPGRTPAPISHPLFVAVIPVPHTPPHLISFFLFSLFFPFFLSSFFPHSRAIAGLFAGSGRRAAGAVPGEIIISGPVIPGTAGTGESACKRLLERPLR